MNTFNLKNKLKFSRLLLVAVALFSLQSCLDDNDFEGYTWRALGLVKQGPDSSYYIKSDYGDTLLISSDAVSYFKLNDSLRVITDFVLRENTANTDTRYHVGIQAVRKVLFKNPVDRITFPADSLGTSKISLGQAWFVRDMLNVEFAYLGGGNVVHYINLAYNGAQLQANPDTLDLELRHNDGKDPFRYETTGFVTFNMKNLQKAERDSVVLRIKSDGIYGSEKIVYRTYKY